MAVRCRRERWPGRTFTLDGRTDARIVYLMATLIAGEPRFVYPLLEVDFTDTDSGASYAVRMDAEGSFLHDHGTELDLALAAWTESALHPSGKRVHEDWKALLTTRNARHH